MSLYLLNLLMDQVDTLHVGRYWSELLCYIPPRPTCVTLRSRSRTSKFCVKVSVQVFKSLYLLNMLMYQVDTLHVGRYWSEVLCCIITTNQVDTEVKVTDLEILF